MKNLFSNGPAHRQQNMGDQDIRFEENRDRFKGLVKGLEVENMINQREKNTVDEDEEDEFSTDVSKKKILGIAIIGGMILIILTIVLIAIFT